MMEAPVRLSGSALPEPCQGFVAPGFSAVAEAFAENFRTRGEVGAALSVYLRGEPVVDLWGGVCNSQTGAPWQSDTMVCGFSTSKGVAAAAVALAVARGHLTYDVPAARLWPDFAAARKGAVTLRDVLEHRAGLSHLDVRIALDDLANRETLASILARQKPLWNARRHWGYHAMSWGFYLDEIMRRADPQGRGIGRFFAGEIAGPLGLDYHIGLPSSVPGERLARLDLPGRTQVIRGAPRLPRAMVGKVLNPMSRLQRSLRVVRGFNVNDRPWLEAEICSANGIGEVRALGRLYGLLALGGEALGLTRPVFEALTAPAEIPPGGGRDLVMGVESRWRLGFAKPSPAFPFAASDRAFGMPGMGGAFAYADPELELGYAYVPMRLGIVPFDEPRETALREAIAECLP